MGQVSPLELKIQLEVYEELLGGLEPRLLKQRANQLNHIHPLKRLSISVMTTVTDT